MANGGPAGEVGGRTLREIFEDAFNRNVHPSVPDSYRTKVVNYSYQGKDSRGNRVYKIALKRAGKVNYTTRAFDGQELLAPEYTTSPRSSPHDDPGPDHLGARGDQAALDREKQRWHSTILGMTLSPLDEMNLTRFVDGWTGSAQNLSQIMQRKIEEAALKGIDATVDTGGGAGGEEQFDLTIPGLGGGGGGFGGGFSGPQYVSPDRRVVDDFVSGALNSLVGSIPSEGLKESLVDHYMAEHRKNFDRPSEEIDPAQSVQEAIRDTDEYQVIHALRPESEDERKWVAARRQAAERGGLDTGRQQDFAITQATAGGDVDDVERAASVAQLQQSGNVRGTQLEDQLRAVTQAMFRGVVR